MTSLSRLLSLADGPWQTARLGAWYTGLQARKRVLGQSDPTSVLRAGFRWHGRPFSFELRRILDLHVLNEVFLSDEYALPQDENIGTVLDLGANIGASVVCFALLFPKARIAAFEPNPECRDSLRANVAPFGDRVSVHQEAIAPSDGEVTFYQNKEHWGGSLIRRSESVSYAVPTQRLKTALDALGWPKTDLVKIDIEGGEYAVAADLAALRPGQIIAEVHPDIVGTPYETFRETFADYRDQALYQHGERAVVHMKRRENA